ncbi:MAG: citrate transporter [Clostridia bacterium]|nr:citrate transporter [Clostridia bacterium]
MNIVLKFIRKNLIFTIAWFLAIITIFLVPIDKEYLSYFDFKTLACLFCALAVVCALRHIYFFQIVAKKIVCIFKNTRTAVLALVYITFIGSMLIANDMALITFLPLGYFVLSQTNHKELMSFTFIMQNISANLGGMLTPFGNPQNLYLYSYMNIPTKEFFEIMFPPFIISVTLITICCLFIKKEPLTLSKSEADIKLKKDKTIIYSILFALSIAVVFDTIPFMLGVIIITISMLFLDRDALLEVDYGLLLTFCAFFIFSGNLARIDAVKNIISALIDKNTLLVSVLSCQVISNVPSAVLLSHFTKNYPALLIGVNIGGTGTPISSLASLITLSQYSKHEPGKIKQYMLQFTIYNFSILLILLTTMLIRFK